MNGLGMGTLRKATSPSYRKERRDENEKEKTHHWDDGFLCTTVLGK